jgi:hypothetical protein
MVQIIDPKAEHRQVFMSSNQLQQQQQQQQQQQYNTGNHVASEQGYQQQYYVQPAGLTGFDRNSYGSGGYGDYPTTGYSYAASAPSSPCFKGGGVNPFLIMITLAGAGVGFYFIYNKLTMIAGRKKRGAGDDDFMSTFVPDVVWAGACL